MEERIISIEKKQNVILVFVVISALLSLFAFVSGLGDNRTYSDETDDTDFKHRFARMCRLCRVLAWLTQRPQRTRWLHCKRLAACPQTLRPRQNVSRVMPSNLLALDLLLLRWRCPMRRTE